MYSAYAVWNLRDTISQNVIDNSPNIKRYGLGVFITVVNGFWLILCTLYIAIIEDELAKVDVYYITKDPKTGKILSKVKVDSYITTRMGKNVAEKLGSIMSLTHIILGFLYLFLCILFINVNELFLLELILYGMCLIIGAVSFEYFFLNNTDEHGGRTLMKNDKYQEGKKTYISTEPIR